MLFRIRSVICRFFKFIVITICTDNLESVVISIRDRKLGYIYWKNEGAHNTINRGLEVARNDYKYFDPG